MSFHLATDVDFDRIEVLSKLELQVLKISSLTAKVSWVKRKYGVTAVNAARRCLVKKTKDDGLRSLVLYSSVCSHEFLVTPSSI